MESGDIDHGRRRFVEVAAVSVAAAATLSLLPEYAAARNRKQRNPPVPHQRSGRSARRPPPAHRCHAMA